jgi:hypothetical protein
MNPQSKKSSDDKAISMTNIDWNKASLDMSYSDEGAVVMEDPTIGLKKPNREHFFMVHKIHHMCLQLLEIKEDKELRGNYLVPPNREDELTEFFNRHSNLIQRKTIVLCINPRGHLWLWPVAPIGSKNRWHISATRASEMAKQSWVRMVSGDQEYQIYKPSSPNMMDPPQWPEISFSEALDSAFEGRVIDSLKHPIVSYLEDPASQNI